MRKIRKNQKKKKEKNEVEGNKKKQKKKIGKNKVEASAVSTTPSLAGAGTPSSRDLSLLS